MGIYVYITRKPLPAEDAGPDISEQEWRSLATAQRDFRLPSAEERQESLGDMGPSVDSYLVWTAHPEVPDVWFGWFRGEIAVKHPDPLTLARMKALARLLGARVVSELGEQFDDLGDHAGFEEWSEHYEPPAPPKQSFFFAALRPEIVNGPTPVLRTHVKPMCCEAKMDSAPAVSVRGPQMQ